MGDSVLFQRRQWQPTPVLLPRGSHGWRSLMGCSPWGHEESDTTEQLHFDFSLSSIGRKWQPTPVFLPGESIQGTGEPGGLPSMGSHKSRARLKWLSSSSSSSSSSTLSHMKQNQTTFKMMCSLRYWHKAFWHIFAKVRFLHRCFYSNKLYEYYLKSLFSWNKFLKLIICDSFSDTS